MVEVTTQDVTKIYPTTLDVQSFLDIATTLATNLLSGKGLDDSTTKSIIIYLTAHLLVLTEENGGLRRQRLGDGDESYLTPDPKAVGFATTRFGQTAMILDPTGTLAGASAGSSLRAVIEVISGPGDQDYASC